MTITDPQHGVPERDVYWVPYITDAPWCDRELRDYVGACVVADSEADAIAQLFEHYRSVMPQIKVLKTGKVRRHGSIHIIAPAGAAV